MNERTYTLEDVARAVFYEENPDARFHHYWNDAEIHDIWVQRARRMLERLDD